MDLTIIIVSWNVKEKLKNNLLALFKNTANFNFEVFVVDNNSLDKSSEMVAKNFPQVKLIQNKKNLGFAKANNQAIKKSKGKYVLLLNPDMQILPDTLKNMLDWMKKNPQAAIAGCHLIDEKNKTIKQIREFPSFLDQLAIILKLPHLFPGILKKYLCQNFDYSKAAKVSSIRGAFFMITRNTMEKIGLLDERYFVWFEEVDYCKRAKKYNLEVWYTPVAKCVDYVGQSFKQLPKGNAQKYFRDSMLKYFKRWHPLYQYWILKLVWPIGMLMAKIYEKKNRNNN